MGEKKNSVFNFNEITMKDLLLTAKKFKPKTSSGDDNISTKLLIYILPIIGEVLLYLINLSLETGYIPDELKIAKVIPIYKNSGAKDDFTNYRPISLLSALSKLFEKVVEQQVYEYFI